LKNSKRILAAFNNKYEIESQRRLLWVQNSIYKYHSKYAPQIAASKQSNKLRKMLRRSHATCSAIDA
jgi:hypothetical protein